MLGDQVALIDGVENFEGARDFEPVVIGGRLRRIAQSDGVHPKPRAGELAVIAGRIACRRFVIGARFLPAAERFLGAALPIIRARPSVIGLAVPSAMRAKWPERDRRLMQEAQRNPSGGKLLLGAMILVDRRRAPSLATA